MSKKWIVLCTYNDQGTDRIVFVKKKKNGMLCFRTKSITPKFTCSYNLKTSLFDIKEQFKKITIS